MDNLQYPIGKFHRPEALTEAERANAINEIAVAPKHLRQVVTGLNDTQLDTPYRPGGWTVRQVAHHIPDSHINSYIRFRLALTEDEPTIKPYEEARWAELSDARTMPVEPSLVLLEAMHSRWVNLLHSMAVEDFARTFRHPELGLVTLDGNVALYAWHGRHHVAQISNLRDRMRW
jgi:hypothetical protein